jgi:hypothetical protein
MKEVWNESIECPRGCLDPKIRAHQAGQADNELAIAFSNAGITGVWALRTIMDTPVMLLVTAILGIHRRDVTAATRCRQKT